MCALVSCDILFDPRREYFEDIEKRNTTILSDIYKYFTEKNGESGSNRCAIFQRFETI